MKIELDHKVTIPFDTVIDTDRAGLVTLLEESLNSPAPLDSIGYGIESSGPGGITFRVQGTVDEDELNAALAYDRRA